jgi:hypothetical protein
VPGRDRDGWRTDLAHSAGRSPRPLLFRDSPFGQ